MTSPDGTDSQVISLVITGSNDGPVAVADTASTTEDTGIDIAVLGNDQDVDGTATDYVIDVQHC